MDKYAPVNTRGIPHLHTKGESPEVARQMEQHVAAMKPSNLNTDHEPEAVFNPAHHEAKKAPLGSGKRFAALKGELAKRPGVKDPGALAAYIGAKKYGRAKMSKMAAKGRKRGS